VPAGHARGRRAAPALAAAAIGLAATLTLAGPRAEARSTDVPGSGYPTSPPADERHESDPSHDPGVVGDHHDGMPGMDHGDGDMGHGDGHDDGHGHAGPSASPAPHGHDDGHDASPDPSQEPDGHGHGPGASPGDGPEDPHAGGGHGEEPGDGHGKEPGDGHGGDGHGGDGHGDDGHGDEGPEPERPRELVFGSFAAINALVLAGAAFVRRRDRTALAMKARDVVASTRPTNKDAS
jgi:hypothetical protein